MKLHIKSTVLGFAIACLLGVGVIAAFLFSGPDIRTTFHEITLPSGKVVKVTACHFAWGVEHDERHANDDRFALEYVSTVPHTDPSAVDGETREVFELIRRQSELWGLKVADVAAFPSTARKGRYFAYVFSRNADGDWTLERTAKKVFVTD